MVDLPNLEGKVQQQKKNTQGFLSKQQGQTDDFLSRYRSTLGGQEKTAAMADRIGTELGLPALQKNALLLNQTVSDLPQTLLEGTRGFDVNQNQLNQLTSHKLSKLAPAAQRATEQAQSAQNTLNTRLGYESLDRDRELLPFQTEQSLLSDRLARETTLYSQDNQNELDALIAKMNAGITLSEGEKNRAAQLAESERSYELEKGRLAQDQSQFDTTQENRDPTNRSTATIEQGGQTYLIDTQTGKVIAKYGATQASVPTSSYYGPTANTTTNEGVWK